MLRHRVFSATAIIHERGAGDGMFFHATLAKSVPVRAEGEGSAKARSGEINCSATAIALRQYHDHAGCRGPALDPRLPHADGAAS
jgi:hypothetical protein